MQVWHIEQFLSSRPTR